jgi:hypothetical protein
VICTTCRSEQEFVEGRCVTCGGAATVRCPKCRNAVEKGERFCGKCGAKIPTRADRIRAVHQSKERQANLQSVNRGRRWMLIIAVFILFWAAFSYFSGMSEVDKTAREAVTAFEGMTPAERDVKLKQDVGMTWQELVDHDRGMVTFQAAVFGTLGAIFLGLWWWAQSNPFAATLTALLLYITFMLVNAMVDPASLLRGIIVKIVVVAALFSAVSAGYRERARRRRVA